LADGRARRRESAKSLQPSVKKRMLQRSRLDWKPGEAYRMFQISVLGGLGERTTQADVQRGVGRAHADRAVWLGNFRAGQLGGWVLDAFRVFFEASQTGQVQHVAGRAIPAIRAGE
jgi:hypothetical protein